MFLSGEGVKWVRLLGGELEQSRKPVLTGGDGSVGGNLDAVKEPGDPENLPERDAGQPGDGCRAEKISGMFDVPDLGNSGERVHGDLRWGKRVNFDVHWRLITESINKKPAEEFKLPRRATPLFKRVAGQNVSRVGQIVSRKVFFGNNGSKTRK